MTRPLSHAEIGPVIHLSAHAELTGVEGVDRIVTLRNISQTAWTAIAVYLTDRELNSEPYFDTLEVSDFRLPTLDSVQLYLSDRSVVWAVVKKLEAMRRANETEVPQL